MAISLKAARVNAGLTQADLAEKVGVSKLTYWKWETGKSEPKYTQFKKLCEVCGVDKDEVFLPTT
jgi:DNA-binding XRE family transcriptional regulator